MDRRKNCTRVRTVARSDGGGGDGVSGTLGAEVILAFDEDVDRLLAPDPDAAPADFILPLTRTPTINSEYNSVHTSA
jgi:hypothetical protein